MDVADVAARFWPKVSKAAGDECWEWTASLNSSGYGQLWIDGRPERAHRIAWMLSHGEMPQEWVLHRCDNRRCVRVSHLYVGSHSDNTRDMVERNGARMAGMDECERGHPLVGDNRKPIVGKNREKGWIQCRECSNESHRRMRARGRHT